MNDATHRLTCSEAAGIEQLREAVLVDISRYWRAEIEAQIFAEQRRYDFRRHRRLQRGLQTLGDIPRPGRQHDPLHYISPSGACSQPQHGRLHDVFDG